MADSDLQRTHPATVAIRTVKSLGQAIVGFIALAFVSLSNRSTALASLGLGALIVLGTLVISGFSWLNWLYFRYGIDGDHLVIHEGLWLKKNRSIPLARVQGVDIRADLMSRLLGLADVMVQTAGGGDASEARIGAIPLAAAEQLRADIIAGARTGPQAAAPSDATAPAPLGGADARTVAADPARPATTLVGADPLGRMSDFRGVLGGARVEEVEPVFEHQLSIRELIVAGLTSNAPIIAVAATIGVAGQAADIFGAGAIDSATSTLSRLAFPALVVVGLLAFALTGAVAALASVARDYGFTVRRAGGRLETEAGLLERRMTSVPIRRIQAVLFEATPVRRVFRLAALRVNTAGFGRKENDEATASALVPIARSGDLRMLLHNLLPEADVIPLTRPAPRRALRFYIVWPTSLAIGITLAVVGGPLAANAAYEISEPLLITTPLILTVAVVLVGGVVASLRALTWHSAGCGVSGNALAIDYGTLGSYKVRITRSRIQSLSVRQSFFQRRARLATLVVASVSGSSRALFTVRHLDHDDALKIERWYSPDESAEPPAPDAFVATDDLPDGQPS